MDKVENLICITCPIGCNLAVTSNSGDITVTGNMCNRGIAYAKTELTMPKRTVTTSVKLQSGQMLSVKTSAPIAKEKIFECIAQIKKLKLTAPISIGQILIKDYNNECDIVATNEIL